eukprot:CFRG2403T1
MRSSSFPIYFCTTMFLVTASALAQLVQTPQIVGVQIAPESLETHHTSGYRIELGFVIRQNQKFNLIVETDHPLKNGERIYMNANSPPEEVSPKFVTHTTQGRHDKEYVVTVLAGDKEPLGKYEEMNFYVAESKHGQKKPSQEYLYTYPFPIYLIFNPWHPSSIFHMENLDELDEYVLSEQGPVYTGTAHTHEAIDWYYGNQDELALEAVFWMLKTMDSRKRHDPLSVLQHISHNIGMVNMTDKHIPFRGRADGVLEGRWAEDFPGGLEPGYWNSTIDIISRWKAAGHKPVKYGQCWVFAAIQNTYLRAVGIPARQTSAMASMVGAAARLYVDHLDHHVVNYYYDRKGTLVYKEGHVWNFHSWNDVFMRRKVDKYSGWQVIDGTPGGSGPAPIKAIHDLDDNAEFNTTILISCVHATLREFLVDNCTKPLDIHSHDMHAIPKPGYCHIDRELKYKTDGVPLVITKNPGVLDMGKDGERDITNLFVDPKMDAYIPSPHNPWENDTLSKHSIPNNHDIQRQRPFALYEGDQQLMKVYIKIDEHRSNLGEPIYGEISVLSPYNDWVDIILVVDLKTYDGQIIQEVHRVEHAVSVEEDVRLSLPVTIQTTVFEKWTTSRIFAEVRVLAISQYADEVVLQKSTVMLSNTINIETQSVHTPVSETHEEMAAFWGSFLRVDLFAPNNLQHQRSDIRKLSLNVKGQEFVFY